MMSIGIIGVVVFMGALTWGILAQERREERRKRGLQERSGQQSQPVTDNPPVQENQALIDKTA